MKKRILVVAVAAGLLASPPAAEASGGMKVVDALIVRPFCMVGSVVSTTLYLATLPITAPTGVSHEAASTLVTAPWRFTAYRYLGEWHEYRDGRDVRGWSDDERRRADAWAQRSASATP